ncbi:class I adenylate-forming enzyme family protein [Gordonia sp. KTR9]|uniref:class I adenylate-forming enzyme family protein n=1 Tax=Gordonia sp. KTR9 TaxID=337191 RepID=UPI00027DDC15|nr:class I adenylate-forming enzyme family protein [Gordonia sp. KTR9]AFR48200.1 long chain fatty acid-CoA ligase [Gordonia sp. KTR9]
MTSARPPLANSYWPKDQTVALVESYAARQLADVAGDQPNRIALIGLDHRGSEAELTYSEVERRVAAIAVEILHRTKPGDHIAILAPNVVEWPLMFYAISLTGRVVVALNPRAGYDEIRYTLSISDSVMLLHGRQQRDSDVTGMVPHLVAECSTVLESYSLEEVAEWAQRPSPPSLLERRAWPEVNVRAPGMMQFTSGTTGRPKAVMLAHRSMVNVSAITMHATGVPRGSKLLSPFPQFHTAGCVTSTLGSLALGGTLIIVDRWDAVEVMKTISTRNVTTALLVPTMLQDLLNVETDDQVRIPTILVGAANVPGWVIEETSRRFGGNVLNVYGQTESCAPVIATRHDDSVADVTNTIGRPLPQVECALLEIKTGKVADIGVAGEICIRGFQQMLGYYRDPEATARAVTTDGWLRTGDIGTMDHRGVLRLTGRLKELIIRGGENISPDEVRGVLLRHPEVRDAAVVGLPDERLGETVAAVLVTSPGKGSIDAMVANVKNHCAGSLAQYKVPQKWFFASELPMTASGKIKTLTVRSQILAGQLPSAQQK